MASSSTSSIRKNFKYHVFLSFRGEDTRKTFVDHLYASLKRLGIRTFRDNEELEKGKRIDELFKAIEESKFFVIVFSQNYASSSWCLKELAKIMECQDGNQHIAYPLFYDVEPRDIRKQTGPVGRAIAKYKTNEHFKEWEKALENSGNLVGWDLEKIADGHEAEAIDLIVKEISFKLRSIHLSKDENLVGMESRMQDLESSLRMDLDDEVRMIGIWGMGGAGKTTLARAIYQKLSSQFDGKSFVDNVREASKGFGGLLSLQKQVIRDVLGHSNVNSFQDAIYMMKERMPLKKVLLVLDDVDHVDQLEALAGALDWFKGGSRIIVTARDKQVLKAHGVNWIHDINFLSNEEAFSLFNRYAFKRYIPIEGYEELSFKVVCYAAGLPLTLKVLGSSLFGRKKPVWKDTLKRLETIPSRETLEVLEISYNSLENDHKEMFLDVACCMKMMPKEEAIRELESRGFHAIIGLTVLEDRSLITIDRYGCLGMHDSIEELGKNIVRRSHPREPNKHSRLWVPKEIEALMSDDEVTEATATCIRVEWLHLQSPGVIMKGLGKLKKLRLLHISERQDDMPPSFLHMSWRNNDRPFSSFHMPRRNNDMPRKNWMSDQDNFPNALQFLKWERYPGHSLPQTFQANNLVGLEMPNSRIMQLWESGEQKVLSNLRFLNLSNSKLTTLNLEMTQNLERLDLYLCCDLTRLDVPAGGLKRLVYLNLLGCSSLISSSFIHQLKSPELRSLTNLRVTEEIPRSGHDDPWHVPDLSFTCLYAEEQDSSLENSQKYVSLSIQPGTTLESFSGSFFGLQHLKRLTLKGRIPEVPDDIDQLKCLEHLTLQSTHIKCLPDSMCMLKPLKSFELNSQFLEELPRDFGQLVCLEKLTLSYARIKHLPDSICMMKNLKSLQLIYCASLEELPRDFGQLVCLEKLTLSSERIKYLPDSICMMQNLTYLKLKDCKHLQELPRDLGQLECLEELILKRCKSLRHIPNSIGNMKLLKNLDIRRTGIRQLPQSISLLEGLRVFGDVQVLQPCDFASAIETFKKYGREVRYFCYIKAVNSTPAPTDLRSQSTENNLKRNFAEHQSTNTEIELTDLFKKVRIV